MSKRSRTRFMSTAPVSPNQLTDGQLDVLLALDDATEGGAGESVRYWGVSESRRGGAPLAWSEQRRLERSTAVILGALEELGLAIKTHWKHVSYPYDHFNQWELSQAGLALLGRSVPSTT